MSDRLQVLVQDAEAGGKEGAEADAAAGGRLALDDRDGSAAALLADSLLLAMAAGGPSGGPLCLPRTPGHQEMRAT